MSFSLIDTRTHTHIHSSEHQRRGGNPETRVYRKPEPGLVLFPSAVHQTPGSVGDPCCLYNALGPLATLRRVWVCVCACIHVHSCVFTCVCFSLMCLLPPYPGEGGGCQGGGNGGGGVHCRMSVGMSLNSRRYLSISPLVTFPCHFH